MRHLVMLSAVLLGLGLMAGPAAALPAPMSERAAAKERPGGAGPHQVRHLHRCHQGCRTGEDLPSYSASAELMEVIKGEEVKGDTVNIIFHAIATGLLGPWTVFIPARWYGRTSSASEYTTIWWNGRGSVVSQAVITELPTKPGETAEIPKNGK
ncbi:MAG: hypothetical protein ACXWVQ_12440 [Methyloceanibacter sp.]